MSVVKLTDQNFKEEVLASDLPVIVDFWAPWCGPCQLVGPVMEELADAYKGEIKIGKVNVDENRETATSFEVMSIPTIIYFVNGRETKRVVGARKKADFERELGLGDREASGR